MICDLHEAIAIDWKSVVTGGCNVRAENRKTLRREQVRLLGLQVKDGLPAGTEEFFCKRQQIRSPRAHRHHDNVTGDSLSVIEHDSFHATVVVVQLRKSDAFPQFDTE